MAQQKPEENLNLNQILKLVDRLSPCEREELYKALYLRSWGDDWRALCASADKQNKNLPPLSEEEILSKMKAIRKEVWTERAQGGS